MMIAMRRASSPLRVTVFVSFMEIHSFLLVFSYRVLVKRTLPSADRSAEPFCPQAGRKAADSPVYKWYPWEMDTTVYYKTVYGKFQCANVLVQERKTD